MQSITIPFLSSLLKEAISDLTRQPEFTWHDNRHTFAVDKDGLPAVCVAAGYSSSGYDLWGGLRNPATIGLYPAGFEEVWDFYANRRKQKTDETGRATIFQVARTFEEAKKQYGRAVVVSVMLPVASEVFTRYNEVIHSDGQAPWEGYGKVWEEVNTLLDKGVTRAAYRMMDASRPVVVMNGETVDRVSRESLPQTHQGGSHGVCKGGNFPQKSVAVLTGLAQFGVSRLVFRDEPFNGGFRRLMGPLRSLVLFDNDVSGEADGLTEITDQTKAEIAKLSDFTDTTSAVNQQRYCTYIPENGEKGCGKCIAFCPSRALRNSSPRNEGAYGSAIAGQEHRFWDGKLQFDNGSCCDERGQLASLYDEWMCGRCVSVCAGEGVIRDHSNLTLL